MVIKVGVQESPARC